MRLLLALALATPPDTSFSLGPGVTASFVWIEPGEFQMGALGASRPVLISRGFWLATVETRWIEWDAVMDGRVEPHAPDHPARGMSWPEIQQFLARLTARTPGWTFRLPTEAEWEYAARAGTSGDWSFGDTPERGGAFAWTRENARGVVQSTGTRRPNPWGLYDMHGNVWEWVSDWYAGELAGPATDPTGPSVGSEKVRRGGSAIYTLDAARSWHRYRQPPGRGNTNIGFRMVAQRTGSAPGAER